MINKINNFFHTNTTLGKIFLFISFYLIFWFLSYGFWTLGSWSVGFKNLLLNNILILFKGLTSFLVVIFNNFSIYSFLLLIIIIYFLLFLPIISFVLLKKIIIPCLGVDKKCSIYIFNVFFIFFSIWYFVSTIASTITLNIL
jgi:hypothetical protein